MYIYRAAGVKGVPYVCSSEEQYGCAPSYVFLIESFVFLETLKESSDKNDDGLLEKLKAR